MSAVEVCVARVGRAHGIRGDVVLDVRTDEPERRLAPGAVLSTERGQQTITSTRWHAGRMLARFDGVGDRTAAEALAGLELHVAVEADERPGDPDEFYDHQLVGLSVVDADGRERGDVVGVSHLPQQDLLVVRTDAGERLVPFVAALVPVVDLEAGSVRVSDVAGLIDDEADA